MQYAPRPGWVTPPPTPTQTQEHEGAAVRVVYQDTQTRLGDSGEEMYTAYRIKLLKPEALGLGNIQGAWNPGSDDLVVHELKVLRGKQVIDVLAKHKFEVIQRENNLENSVLNGQLTATLQVPGLQVGDEIVFAATLRHNDPILGRWSSGAMQMPWVGTLGAFRGRVVWPQSRKVQWQATPDFGPVALKDLSAQRELIFEMRDPQSSMPPDGAPERYKVRRMLEYSGLPNWATLSKAVWPLFDQASRFTPEPSLRAEIDRIAKASSDPVKRIEAALALVQERIRYVYVGLDGGNYRPLNAGDTWRRRFGDCKAKSVLLMAVLRELGIRSEAVLVRAVGSDGTDQRLPTPRAFNHVVVRAVVDGQNHWLDGTRVGDLHLASLPAPTFRWALPLREAGAELESVPIEVPKLPQQIEVIDIDASAGFKEPAKVSVELILRGDAAIQLKLQLGSLQPVDAERVLRSLWKQKNSLVQSIRHVDWRFDEQRNTLVLAMKGDGKPDWDGDDDEGRKLDIAGAGFTAPDKLERPQEQDQTAPWATDFSSYKCWATTIRLPPNTPKWRWKYKAAPVNEQLGGVAYWRTSSLHDGVMRTVMSKRVLQAEISPAMAEALNARLPKFNNNISQVFQSAGMTPLPSGPTSQLSGEQADAIDWTSPTAPCAGPANEDEARASPAPMSEKQAQSAKRDTGARAVNAAAPKSGVSSAFRKEDLFPLLSCVGEAASAKDKRLMVQLISPPSSMADEKMSSAEMDEKHQEEFHRLGGPLFKRVFIEDCGSSMYEVVEDFGVSFGGLLMQIMGLVSLQERYKDSPWWRSQTVDTGTFIRWRNMDAASVPAPVWHFEAQASRGVLEVAAPVVTADKAVSSNDRTAGERVTCAKMVEPTLRGAFWRGNAEFKARMHVRAGRVHSMEIHLLEMTTDSVVSADIEPRMADVLLKQYELGVQMVLARNLAEALAGYECSGEGVTSQGFNFRVQR